MKKTQPSLNGTYALMALGVISFGLTIWMFSVALADPPPTQPRHISGANTQATFQNASQMVLQGQ